MIALAENIEAPGAWHLHIVGALPPGIDPALMEATVMSSISVIINLSSWVRFYAVEMHVGSPEEVKGRLIKQLEAKQIGKPSRNIS